MSVATSNNYAGRPRDKQSRKAILAATLKALQDRGYANLALEAVAKQAGVGKTTIYRWWTGKAALAVEAFFDDTVLELRMPETGSAAEDFRLQLQQLAKLLRSRRGEILAALIVGSRTETELASALQTHWVKPRMVWGVARLQRAIKDGECVPGLDVYRALDTLYSPLYAHLFLGRPVHSPVEIDAHCAFLRPVIFRGAEQDAAE